MTTRGDLDAIDKRNILINLKNADSIMKHWTNQEFSTFLYRFYSPRDSSYVKDIENAEDMREQEEISKKITTMSDDEKKRYLESLQTISDETVKLRGGKSYKRNNIAIQIIKELRGSKCQICHVWVTKKDGTHYVEGAHIDSKHKKGSEKPENILILCPNHHKEFDLGSKKIINRTTEKITFKLNGNTHTISLKVD